MPVFTIRFQFCQKFQVIQAKPWMRWFQIGKQLPVLCQGFLINIFYGIIAQDSGITWVVFVRICNQAFHFSICTFIIAFMVTFKCMSAKRISCSVDRTLYTGCTRNINEEQIFSFITTFIQVVIRKQILIYTIRIINLIPKVFFVLAD